MSELPNGWINSKLKDSIFLNEKLAGVPDDTECGFVPMALVPTKYGEGIQFESRIWAECKKGYTQFQNNDVLLAKITPCFENGKGALVSGLPNGIGAGSTEYFVLRSVGGLVEPKYLHAFVKTKEFLINCETNMSGSVGHRRVPKDYLLNYTVPLAPLPEQKRIVEKLDEVLAQVDTIKARLDGIPDLLKRFRQSVLASAVSGKLTEEWRGKNQNALDTVEIVSAVSEERKTRGFKAPRNLEDITDVPFSIPDCWAWLRAGDLCLKITDGAHNTPKLVDSGFPYLMAKDLTGGGLDFSEKRLISEKEHRELYNKCQPEIGDLLVVNIGAGTGNNVLVDVDYEFSFKNIAILKRSMHVLPSYFKYFFDSQKKRIFDEQTRGGAQPFLSLTILNNLLIALPSLEEQKEIVRLVDQYFAFADTIEAQVKKAQARVDNLTQSILAKAFRGELVPQNDDDEPAEVLLERIAKARKEAEALAKVAKKAGKQSIKNNK